MVITRADRVSDVLRRDPSLVEVFASVSPHFERLRKPALRRVMARLVTVEQAARIAGVDADRLLARLNAAGGDTPAAAAAPEPAGSKPAVARRAEQPVEVRTGDGVPERVEGGGPTEPSDAASRSDTAGKLAPDGGGSSPPPGGAGAPRIVDLDVRDDLRQGREPFSRIMAAVQALEPGDVLRLRAIFEPVPLYAVLAKRGFVHQTEQLAEDDWRVSFRPTQPTDESGPTPAAPPGIDAAQGAGNDHLPGSAEAVVLDVRGLEPPEPMVRTLAALESLPEGATLVQINVRVPQFLLPRLDELGYEHRIREQSDDLVRIFIRRRDERGGGDTADGPAGRSPTGES